MKALRWYGRKDLRYEDVPEPSPGPGQLKIKVTLAGICGTDLKEYATGPHMIPPDRVPLTLGHEFAGTVDTLGKGVTDFNVGDRVSGVGYYYCGECYVCKEGRYNLCVNQGFTGLTTDGCMAEFFVLPAYACYKLPDTVSDEYGALVEPLAVSLHAVRQGKVQPGDTVAIVGDGAIGLGALLAARAAGASEVYLVAKHKGRGGLAEKLGATAVIYLDEGNPVQKLMELTGGIGVNAAIECVGYPDTPQLTVELTRRGGIAVITGVFEKPGTIDFSTILFTERMLVGSSIYIHEGRTVIDLLADGRIDPGSLITSIVPLKDAAELGFEQLVQNKEANIKVLLSVP
ncbi:MAG: alcohol dehydrogenase catalytic domain-containing protein [Dehalococcoidales bacterium]|nr:alcohol dehydrogenase catalytic domain-containing protein [Dehalococcoidales bacterium]